MLRRPVPGAPIKALERLWLDTAYLYEELNETVMKDADWDSFAKELNDRREEWSPYFKHSLPSEDYNPGTTGSGLNWRKGIPFLVSLHLRGLDGDYSSLYHRHRNCYTKEPS